MMKKKSALKESPRSSTTSNDVKSLNEPKRVALLDSLEFMNETWDSLYRRSSLVDRKSLDVQMLAFSISAVLQKTQSFIKLHHTTIPRKIIPKLKEILQEIRKMIHGLLEATKTEFESQEALLSFIHANYIIVQQFSVELHEYLLNEKILLKSPDKYSVMTNASSNNSSVPVAPTPLKIEKPSVLSYMSTDSPPSDIISVGSLIQSPPSTIEFMRSSVRSSSSSVNNGLPVSPLLERRNILALERPKVQLIEDHLLDKFVCNEVLKCYHFIIQKYPRTKKHLPLLDLSGNADEQDEQILSHFLVDLCDGVIFCRVYNIIAEQKKMDFIDQIFKPKEWFHRMELVRRFQLQAMRHSWDVYTVKSNAIDALAIAKKTVKGNKHVCALFVKFVHVVGKELETPSWEENLSRWLEYSTIVNKSS